MAATNHFLIILHILLSACLAGVDGYPSTKYASLVDTFWDKCAKVITDKELSFQLARLTVMSGNYEESLEKVSRMDEEIMCEFGVLSLLYQMNSEDKSDEEYAEEAAEAMRRLQKETGDSAEMKSLATRAAHAVGIYFSELSVSGVFVEQVCSSFVCSQAIAYTTELFGNTGLPSSLVIGATAEAAYRSLSVVSAFRDGTLSAAEAEILLASDVTAYAGGLAAGYAGYWLSVTAATFVLGPMATPFLPVIGAGGASIGYALGSEGTRSLLDWFFDGKLSKAQQLQHCREVLSVSDTASTHAIQKAYRKLSKTSHPDKSGGSNEAFLEVSICLGILVEAKQSGGGAGKAVFENFWNLVRRKTVCESPDTRWADTKDTARIFKLISSNSTEKLFNLFEAEPCKLFLRSKDGRGPMWWAHEYGMDHIIRFLLSAGVPVMDQDAMGKTPYDCIPPLVSIYEV